MEKEKILCPSKDSNGEQCGYELLSKFKRCPMCEVQVDKAWFQYGRQNTSPILFTRKAGSKLL